MFFFTGCLIKNTGANFFSKNKAKVFSACSEIKKSICIKIPFANIRNNSTHYFTGAGGPDLLGNVYTPRGNIQVHAPYLEISAFNPRAKQSCTGKILDKKT